MSPTSPAEGPEIPDSIPAAQPEISDLLNFVENNNKDMREREEEPSQHERVPKPGKEKLCEELKEVQKSGCMPARSAVYQAFDRYLKAPGHDEERATYTALKGGKHVREAKERLRKQWSELKLQQSTDIVCRKKESWQNIDEEAGVYEPIMRICELEGGKDDLAAVQATMLYVEKAMKMGGDWVSWNPMTERVDILYVKKSHKRRMVEAWETFETTQKQPVVVQKLDLSLASSSTENTPKAKGARSSSELGTPPKARAAVTLGSQYAARNGDEMDGMRGTKEPETQPAKPAPIKATVPLDPSAKKRGAPAIKEPKLKTKCNVGCAGRAHQATGLIGPDDLHAGK